ncbi:mammalian cell entry protein [Rhodococcus ruber Chol-4]|uniref:Mce family protein n=1 Tax=Rhodococcus ruber TaxID=1830 RepID=A0A098BMC7_9NOCA|nr:MULTISPECIES: MCE family protein [Rhodococcus]MDO2381482.1 MCE family protein [Rhodococcus ruber]KXF85200.1 mammalian cell entry protein [Rhodococcus ruber Chol-4]MBP2212702.1 phospholipid/cholesterol/gamma-HCH transport system substrate-binding protein [Rhodococcus ruber]MCD2126553.1 MCE family protein [Rhodococcus ruber]MCF8781732.1 MCE family protein [Rhodococcus ruber]
MRRSVILGAGACATALAVSACGGAESLPLPGGADVGSDPIHVTVQFDDVLDLVPQSTVKVDGVPVGRVETVSVGPDGWTADVGIVVDSAVELPANAYAAVEQTSLLGEKFVQLTPPPSDPSSELLADGDVIPLDRTRHATELEPVLGALSLLLNGGGVGQLQPVVEELSTAFEGREGTTKSLLQQADRLIDGLDRQRDDITRALDGLDVLTVRVAEQNDRVAAILDDLPVATAVLEQQRPQLTELLVQLDRLGTVGTDVLDQSKENLIADLLALRPTLQQLAASGDDLVKALPFIPTVPFPDGVERIALGGSVNLFLAVDMQIGDALASLGVGQGEPVYRQPKFGEPKPVVDPSNPYYNGNGPRRGWPTVSLLPELPEPRLPAGLELPPGVTLPGLPAAAPDSGAAPANPLEGLLNQLGVGGGR